MQQSEARRGDRTGNFCRHDGFGTRTPTKAERLTNWFAAIFYYYIIYNYNSDLYNKHLQAHLSLSPSLL